MVAKWFFTRLIIGSFSLSVSVHIIPLVIGEPSRPNAEFKTKKHQYISNLINNLPFLKSKSLIQVDNLQNSLIKLTFISKITFTLCQEKQARWATDGQ